MELYLRWIEANEVDPGEELPLGLLLYTEGSDEQVAKYMTEHLALWKSEICKVGGITLF